MRKSNVLWGILFIVCGVLLIVGKLGYIGHVNVLGIFITVVLVYIMVKSLFSLSFGGVLFPLAFLGILYDEQLGITAITPWTILIAAALGSIGLDMIFHRVKCKVRIDRIDKNHHFDHFDDVEVINTNDDSYVKYETSFGSGVKYINTTQLVRADLNSSFGAMSVYFDHAQLKENQAVIMVNCSFAGMELYIPKEWTIKLDINAAFGGVEEHHMCSNDGAKVVNIIGDVKFGSCDIYYI